MFTIMIAEVVQDGVMIFAQPAGMGVVVPAEAAVMNGCLDAVHAELRLKEVEMIAEDVGIHQCLLLCRAVFRGTDGTRFLIDFHYHISASAADFLRLIRCLIGIIGECTPDAGPVALLGTDTDEVEALVALLQIGGYLFWGHANDVAHLVFGASESMWPGVIVSVEKSDAGEMLDGGAGGQGHLCNVIFLGPRAEIHCALGGATLVGQQRIDGIALLFQLHVGSQPLVETLHSLIYRINSYIYVACRLH